MTNPINFAKYTKVFQTVLELTTMSMTKKVLLCQIISLGTNQKCTASNGQIGDMLGMKKTAISNAIKELVQEGYIKSTTFTEHQNTKRWLTPTQKTIDLITEKPKFSVDGFDEEEKDENKNEEETTKIEEEVATGIETETFKEEKQLKQEEVSPIPLTTEEMEFLIFDFNDYVKTLLRDFLKGKDKSAAVSLLKILKNMNINSQIKILEERLRKG